MCDDYVVEDANGQFVDVFFNYADSATTAPWVPSRRQVELEGRPKMSLGSLSGMVTDMK